MFVNKFILVFLLVVAVSAQYDGIENVRNQGTNWQPFVKVSSRRVLRQVAPVPPLIPTGAKPGPPTPALAPELTYDTQPVPLSTPPPEQTYNTQPGPLSTPDPEPMYTTEPVPLPTSAPETYNTEPVILSTPPPEQTYDTHLPTPDPEPIYTTEPVPLPTSAPESYNTEPVLLSTPPPEQTYDTYLPTPDPEPTYITQPATSAPELTYNTEPVPLPNPAPEPVYTQLVPEQYPVPDYGYYPQPWPLPGAPPKPLTGATPGSELTYNHTQPVLLSTPPPEQTYNTDLPSPDTEPIYNTQTATSAPELTYNTEPVPEQSPVPDYGYYPQPWPLPGAPPKPITGATPDPEPIYNTQPATSAPELTYNTEPVSLPNPAPKPMYNQPLPEQSPVPDYGYYPQPWPLPGAPPKPITGATPDPEPIYNTQPATSAPELTYNTEPVSLPDPAPKPMYNQPLPEQSPVPDYGYYPQPWPLPGAPPKPITGATPDPEPIYNTQPATSAPELTYNTEPVSLPDPAPKPIYNQPLPEQSPVPNYGYNYPQPWPLPGAPPKPIAGAIATPASSVSPRWDRTQPPPTASWKQIQSTSAPNWFDNEPASGEFVPNFECKKGDGFYVIANSCDSYIECTGNIAFKLRCPDGLHFKKFPEGYISKLYEYPCVYPSEAKCPEGSERQVAKSTDQCPRQYGFYPMTDGDCNKYIMCQEGIAIVMNCPQGLVFNEETSTCDWPVNVPQCNSNIFKSFRCPDAPLLRNGRMSDIIYKYKFGDQCQKYVACQRGYPRLLSCDLGLLFDEATQSCISEKYVDCAVSVYGVGSNRVWELP